MKKFLIVVLIGLASLCFGVEYNGCFDDANMLKPETVSYIRDIGQKLYDGGRVQFAVKIVEDCNDTLIDGRKYFNSVGIGDKEKNNGLLLFISAKNLRENRTNRLRLLVGYGLEGLFTDTKCGQILDAGLAENTVDAKVLKIVNSVDAEFKALGDNPVPPVFKATLGDIVSIILVVLVLLAVFIFILSLFDEGFVSGGGEYGSGGSDLDGFGGSGGSGGFGGGSCGGGGAGR